MAVRDFPPRPQGVTPDSVPYQNWLDALGNRQNIDLQQELTSVDSADELLIFDASETGPVKTKNATVSNVGSTIAGAGHAGSFTTLTATGLVDISGSGAGQIKFPATQNSSSNANTLDDYREFTWTPVDSSGAGLSMTVNVAKGTKIGNVVNFWLNMQYPVNASGADSLISLPFTLGGSTFGQNIGGCWAATVADVVALAVMGAATMQFHNDGTAARKTNAQLSGATLFVGGAYGV